MRRLHDSVDRGLGGCLLYIGFAAAFWPCLLISAPVGAATLEFPDLDLSSSSSDVRAWAAANQFQSAGPAAPYDEVFVLETPGHVPARSVLSFAADGAHLKMLSFEQQGVMTVPSILRREILLRFGQPVADQIVDGTILRITFPLAHTEPARRVFLIGGQQLSMLLVTDAVYARLQGETEQQEQTEEQARLQAAEAARQSGIEARNAWLAPLGWAVGIAIGAFLLIQILPPGFREPVVRFLGWGFGGLIDFGVGVFDQIFRVMMGIVTFGMMIFSGLAIVTGATEWETSWWWSLLWLSGFATLLNHDSEGGISLKGAFLALCLFVATTAGVLIQKSWPFF